MRILPESAPRRVVVTGIGVTSPVGCSKASFWTSLAEGQSGVAWLSDSGRDGCTPIVAGEARGFAGHIDDFGELQPATRKAIRKALKLMNRETQLGVAAAQHALAESRLHEARHEPDRVGVCFGAGNVSIMPQDFQAGIEACTNQESEFVFDEWGSRGLPQIEPLWLLKCLPNMPACYVAIYNDFRGPNNSITQREASANLAVWEAAGMIADGLADAYVVGGTGTTILPAHHLQALAARDVVLSDENPSTVCRPFDSRRTGSVIAEGAAAFVLEEYNSAVTRRAPIYGEIVGGGSSCVVNVNRVPRCDRALANAIKTAVSFARIDAEQIGHVHAHGLSTPVSDREEYRALHDVFQDRATKIPVVAAKSHTGNAGAGSGAMELAASLLALECGTLFPVINFEQPDADCPVAVVRTNDAPAGDSFLNLSVSPEGQASCLMVRKAA